MNLASIYEKVKNPIEDYNIIKLLIDNYNKSLETGDFYKNLVSKKSQAEPDQKDIDYFYSLMFNEWKNSIIDMSFKQFSSLVKNENYKKNFSKMREFLQKLPDVKTKEEVNNILYGKYKGKDSEIEEILQAYYWIQSDSSDWEYVYYNYIKLKRNSNSNIENLFIINVDKSQIYKVASLIVEKCKNFELPYYFKFDKTGTRIDSIVIGTDSANLVNYLRIFEEIKRKEQSIVASLDKTPILTGRLSSWLGYGSNLSKQSDLDFYDTRAGAIQDAINEYILDYVSSSKENSEFMNLVLDEILKTIEKQGNQNKIVQFGEDEIKEVFLETIPEYLEDFCNKNNKPFDIDDTETGDSISVSKIELENSIKKAVLNNINSEEQSLDEIKNKIVKVSEKYKIDSNKFCFDLNINK